MTDRPPIQYRCRIIGRTADDDVLVAAITRKDAALRFATHVFRRQRSAGVTPTDAIVFSVNGRVVTVDPAMNYREGFESTRDEPPTNDNHYADWLEQNQ